MPVKLQNECVTYVIDASGRNRHFIDRTSGVDHVVTGTPSVCGQVTRGGRTYDASGAAWADGKLTVEFGLWREPERIGAFAPVRRRGQGQLGDKSKGEP